ncbi:glyoxalase [Halobacteriovorax marinus]|uniref:Glyoxalase n=1 Tax=Halobacteriovorax marinus TaxID=97084 RepID=A0A1Y5F4W6_9BACT|nr:glyoxalase [Halobacteriovorax marinus]
MIGYTTVGTDKLEPSAKFYDELLKLVGAKRIMEADDFVAWGNSSEGAMFSIHLPADGKPFSVGNGVMIALKVKDQEQVKELHTRALELGGTDEGKPGFRAEGFYAAYFRDVDGNKLNAHCMVEA